MVERITNEKLSDEFSIDLHRMSERPLCYGVQSWGKLRQMADPVKPIDTPKMGSCKWFIENEFSTIADQLVLLEYEFFSQIDPRDFLQDIWSEKIITDGLSKMNSYIEHISNMYLFYNLV